MEARMGSRNPLFIAASVGRADAMETLLRHGVPREWLDDEKTVQFAPAPCRLIVDRWREAADALDEEAELLGGVAAAGGGPGSAPPVF